MEEGDVATRLRIAMGLIRSIPIEEREQLIQGNHNEHLAALAFATYFCWLENDANGVRTAIDTAFCLGVRAGQRQGNAQ